MLSMLKHYHLTTIPFTMTLPAVCPSVCRDPSDVEAGRAIDLPYLYIDSIYIVYILFVYFPLKYTNNEDTAVFAIRVLLRCQHKCVL